MGTDPHSQHSRAIGSLAGLLLATALLAASGCATAWPLAGQLNAPPASGTAAAASVTDTPARVRANAVGDLVPVDAPAAVAGTVQIDDSPATANLPRRLVPQAQITEPARRSPTGFDPVFRRLEAALNDTDAGPSPPPPPIPRTTGPAPTPQRVVSRPIEPAGGSGSLIPPSSASIIGIGVETTSPTTGFSETPRTLEPAPAIAAVVRLPDVTDWSGTEGPGIGPASASGSSEMARRHVPWWITLFGLVVMVGLIGLSRRLGWPSISPLE